MVRSLFSALLGRARRGARVTPAAPRFVPTVQALEVREVPAVLGLFAAVEPAPAAPVDDAQPAVARTADGYLTITLENVLVSSYSAQASAEGAADATADTAAKVTVQDISFTAKVSKASPMLS